MSSPSKVSRAAFFGFVLLAIGVCCSAVLLWAGEAGLVGTKGSKAPKWPGATFASLAWSGSLAYVGALIVQLRARGSGSLLSLTALGGFLALATGFTIIGIAWAGERQNYWDAYHFSSLAWHSVFGGLVAFFAARSASLRGSEWGSLLKGPSVVCLLLLVLVWLWTWCLPVQELQADIARYFFLRLHG